MIVDSEGVGVFEGLFISIVPSFILFMFLDRLSFRKSYSILLTFRRNDGQYVDLAPIYAIEGEYPTHNVSEWGQKQYANLKHVCISASEVLNHLEKITTSPVYLMLIDNSEVPITSYMQGGGKIEISYFIERKVKKKIGTDVFDFPQLNI